MSAHDMTSTDIDQRPAKKRRFFVEDEPEALRIETAKGVDASLEEAADAHSARIPTPGLLNPEAPSPVSHDTTIPVAGPAAAVEDGFDGELFATIVGQPVDPDTFQKIRTAAKNDMQTAINLYLDGSWEKDITIRPSTVSSSAQNGTNAQPSTKQDTEISEPVIEDTPQSGVEMDLNILRSDPAFRYIGAFGVGAWSTKSGTNLVQHGESVYIERTKIQPTTRPGRGGKTVPRMSSQKGDVITRFTNGNGEEIGRLPRETAEWVSTLIDQKICRFEGVCVFAPERIHVNDTIYLQLRCFLLREAFQHNSFTALGDDNAPPRIFEEQETSEEKTLRLRQVALVKLFGEINLEPTSSSDMTARHKREDLLLAAEMSEKMNEKPKKTPKSSVPQQTGASESSDEEEGEKLDEDQLDTLYKKAQSFDFNTPEMEPGPDFVMHLRKYQKQALHWMLGKEKDTQPERQQSMHPLWEEYSWPTKDMDDQPLPRVHNRDKFYVNPYSGELSLEFPVQEQNCLGGILADEMGLGKTIEMLSLIHSHKSEVVKTQPVRFDSLSTASLNSSRAVPAPYTTLVVAPTSLLAQWESEAMKASKEGSMKVLVYYGSDKAADLRKLCSVANRNSAPNLIITSYGVVRSEHSQLAGRSSITSSGGLFSVDFFRVILDEAHYIKNRASKTARACYDIKGTHRWALTGTPIVNRLEDLFSLVRFLKVEPWSNFSFWKTFITVPFESKDFLRALNVVQTVLEPLVIRRTKTMKTPDGEALVPLPPRTITITEVELSSQEREIYDLIFTRAKRTFNDNVAAGTILKSYTTIFAQILRLRQTCCHPVLTRNQTIVAAEEDAAIATDDANVFKDDMDLQDLIDRFTMTTSSEDADSQQDPTNKFTTHALRQIQTETSGECPICTDEPMVDPAVTSCWHSACKNCLVDYVEHQRDKGQIPRCFSCRETITMRDIFEVIRHKSPNQTPGERDSYDSTPPTSASPAPRISLRRINPLSPTAQTSAKIHALISQLTRLPPNTKSVVFSQFTSFLDLIGPQLTRAGIPHLRFDGTMAQRARAAVLAKFSSVGIPDEEDGEDEGNKRQSNLSLSRSHVREPTPNVLLISLRAGGVGLNLTTANQVFMMDPWWSFATEAQAIDRVHRMGQLKDVSVTRFIVKDSIEGRMLRIQERKMMIAGSLGLRVGGDGGEEERRKERIEELRLLFE
ncbi:DNA repair protein rad5 [Blastomyces dermatitidis ER-3]|uniref:DNA repair protein rad5 n=1 Tax=Ajellomyces dermatitidis (strain ER-3 / ATCC MYA-2586) TaxID=559297 RepID=A0ABP2F063_AJEDR|nr:DNA repair protein rad5 [Blastomyces dermatitidis ER-3]EEQ90005.2 DNA repair protein rad5 [Blastomyces dermatitidis ER-3]